MWSAHVSRREVFELFLGSTKAFEGRVRETSQLSFGSDTEALLVWDYDPARRFELPALVVVADGELQGVLTAVAAAPQAPSPVTALSRILTREEAKQHFDGDVLPIDERVFPAMAALAFVEAVLHGDGRIGIKQLTPLICKRTLSFAWGRTLAARVGGESFLELPSRWLDVYSLLNSPPANDAAQYAVDPVVGALSVLTQIAHGYRPETTTGRLAFELLNGTREGQERAWEQLGSRLSRLIGIDALQSLTREGRGSYLQEALRLMSSGSHMEQGEMAAACAFLATRLAPGSLEHLEVLRSERRPELLAWYGLFAGLQSPKEILSLFGGLGFRLSRDMLRVEEKLSPPAADISFAELRMLARGGLESLASRVGHASELQVELMPYVSSSFTFQLKNRSRSPEGQQSFSNIGPAEPPLSPRARLTKLAADLAFLAQDLPDFSDEYSPARKSRKKT